MMIVLMMSRRCHDSGSVDGGKCCSVLSPAPILRQLKFRMDPKIQWLQMHTLLLVYRCHPFISSAYTLNNKIVKSVDFYRDLGNILTSSLPCFDHYKYIATRVYKYLGLLRRTVSNTIIRWLLRKVFIYLLSDLNYLIGLLFGDLNISRTSSPLRNKNVPPDLI